MENHRSTFFWVLKLWNSRSGKEVRRKYTNEPAESGIGRCCCIRLVVVVVAHNWTKKYWQVFALSPCDPTLPFSMIEARFLDVYVVQKCRSTDLEAWKLQKGRSGRKRKSFFLSPNTRNSQSKKQLATLFLLRLPYRVRIYNIHTIYITVSYKWRYQFRINNIHKIVVRYIYYKGRCQCFSFRGLNPSTLVELPPEPLCSFKSLCLRRVFKNRNSPPFVSSSVAAAAVI